MASAPGDAKVQAACCSAISGWVDNAKAGEKNALCSTLVALGVAPLVVAALRDHAGDAAALRAASGALLDLSRGGAAVADELVAQGGIEAVVAFIPRAAPGSHALQLLCFGLERLVRNAEAQSRAGAGAVEAVVGALWSEALVGK